MTQELSKNDVAWQKLFDKYQILSQVQRSGQFVITSAQINEFRESRLMAKFDHSVNLPRIFRQNDVSLRLSMLPVTRSQYLIGPFETHHKVAYDGSIDVTPMPLPTGLETIDYSNLYSEAAALNCAYNAGIINELIGEETFHTVSGRMSTGTFGFSIASTASNRPPYTIGVDNSQCEIDGGFEGNGHFVLVEAKNQTIEDFLVRQLYYPYRLWSEKVSKRIVPVLMTFSNDTFDFFVYEFADPNNYSSVRLIRQKSYSIAPEGIAREDVSALLGRAQPGPEPNRVPFPQADSFKRAVDLMTLLADSPLSHDDITENYDFDGRQTNYYTDAARYLGLVEKYKDKITGDVTFTLTNDARMLLKQRPKVRNIGLIRKILERQVFYHSFLKTFEQGLIPESEAISAIMMEYNISLNETTRMRRAQTVRGWIAWILDQIED